ncbi:MAG: ATP synthase F1 subunit delta [Actinobacteria bacterium]|nr:ATP synthase F1 subunit delta [Actinomycetota bacterium]
MAVVSRTYAQAFFDAAKEKGSLDVVREELDDFVATLHEVPELDALLRNPQLSPATKSEVLDKLTADSDELVRNFLRVIADRGRGGQIEEIVREFDGLYAAEQQVLNVELTTAYDLSDDDAREIVGQIEQASGRTVEARRTVDPDLIGGIVLKAGSLRVDSSVRGRLNRLRRELATRS